MCHISTSMGSLLLQLVLLAGNSLQNCRRRQDCVFFYVGSPSLESKHVLSNASDRRPWSAVCSCSKENHRLIQNKRCNIISLCVIRNLGSHWSFGVFSLDLVRNQITWY